MTKRDSIKDRKEKVTKLRKKAKDLLSVLHENDVTVSDAVMTLNALRIEVDRLFNDKRLKDTIESLKPQMKTSNKKETKKYQELYDVIKNETITDATMLLDGLSGAIEGEVRHKLSDEPLSILDIVML